MSINSAMLAGSAGLRANASALAAISDNISNVNTVGFKRLRNDFTSLVLQQHHETTYNAGGVSASSRALVGEQGALQSSSVSTHLAISGDGFFVTREHGGDATVSDPFYYTRAGQFSPDTDGYLRNAAGYYLYGWTVEDDGTVTANPSDVNALQPVRITGIGGAAEATTRVSLTANLQASQAISDAAQGLYETNAGLPRTAAGADYNTATNSMALFASSGGGSGVRPDFTSSVQVYDSLGGLRTLTFSFLKSAEAANEWYLEVHMQPSSDITTTGNLADGQIATGVVQFTSSGQLDTTNVGTDPRLFDPRSLAILGSDGTTPTVNLTPPNVNAAANGTAQWAAGLGLSSQNIVMDIGDSNTPGGLTQFDTQSIMDTSQVNGTAFGSLSSVEVDEEGFVTAQFTNGLTKRIYQVPLATFSNVNGLAASHGGAYRAGPSAGPLNMKPAGEAGAGKINPRALEASTVDLAEEFSNLITTQRAYSASSKIITTADEMLDELIRLKR